MLSLLSPSNLGAMAVVALVSGGIGFGVCHRMNSVADYKHQITELQENIKLLREDNAQANLDNIKIEELAKKTKEAADALLDPNGECFSSDDAKQLRELWK